MVSVQIWSQMASMPGSSTYFMSRMKSPSERVRSISISSWLRWTMVGDAVLGAPDALGLEEAVAEHLGEDVVVVALGAELGVGEFSRRHGRTGGDECRIGLGRGCGSGSGSRGPRMSAAALRGEDSGEVGTDV